MPLPKIDELFALLKGVKFFTTLDLGSGYFHIKLNEEFIPTMFGKFESLRLPFGLLQGPDFFIRLIYDLFGLDKSSHNSPGSGYLMYLAYILIYGRMKEEHLDMISKAFECLQNAGLKIKLSAHFSKNKFIT